MNLVEETNTILHQVSVGVDLPIDGTTQQLAKDMFDVMYRHNGIGLAAPQIGVQKQIFVMNVVAEKICINPTILYYSDEESFQKEGCLSFPKLRLPIKRPIEVEVEYININGEKISEKLVELEARCFLHEYDHLNGVTFDLRAAKLSLKLAKQKRKLLTK